MLVEIVTVAILIVLNGALAMSELAIVSASRPRLAAMARARRSGAATALRLAADPGRFLSTVQIGITLIGVLSGAFSGATLGARLAGMLQEIGLSAATSSTLGVGGVVVVITYLSLIVGELVPKQVALGAPEEVACGVAPAMLLLSRVAAPLVLLLDNSGKLVLRLVGRSSGGDSAVTEDEIRAIISEGARAGVLKSAERDMIAGVMRLADRTARALMTPRREVEILDLGDSPEAIVEQLRTTHRGRLPVRDGDEDDIVGIISVRAALAEMEAGKLPDVRAMVEQAPVINDSANAIRVIERLRSSPLHMALVFDELGNFQGVISALDVLEAVTGSFPDEDGDEEPLFAVRADGSWLISGAMPVDEFFDRLDLPRETGSFATVAGFVIDRIGYLPALGDSIEHGGWRIEVVDMDGPRVDRLLVQRIPGAASAEDAGEHWAT